MAAPEETFRAAEVSRVLAEAMKAMRAADSEHSKLLALRNGTEALTRLGDDGSNPLSDLSDAAIDTHGIDPDLCQTIIAKGIELGTQPKPRADNFRRKKDGKSFTRAYEENDKLWQSELQKTATGNVIPNVNNTLLVLENDPDIADRFSFNEMSRAVMIGRAIGGACHDRRMATEVDITETQRWLQINGNIRVSKEIVAQAMESRAAKSSYHPIRDYLNSLTWDGKTRLTTWLSKYLGAENSQYHAGIGGMFMISMVARILEPGCKADHMLVLEGDQGTMKSTACRVLAGNDFFSDNLPDLENKDSSQHLRGKWLVEVAEMHAFDRSETARLKSYITRLEEKYRPPHARLEVVEPRMCVFIGTTNKSAYLKDETGGRRFWPVKTGVIDIDTLRHDRDQLLAEAVVLFNKGTPWWPHADFEREQIKPQQEDRYDADIWEDKVRDWTDLRTRFSMEQVAREALFIETPKINKPDQLRIAAILENLGFKRQRAHGGKRIWVR